MEETKNGGKMELLKLSRFKLKLRALISELKDLRGRERSSTQQLHLSLQKQKQCEDEFGKKVKELEFELASSNEERHKLERKVSYLQNDNALLEIKQKELNETIQSLLQSREQFVNTYQESTSDMKNSIEARDRKLTFFSEKLKSHLLLFDSIEKEALSIKQVVDNVRNVINEKEDVVTGLKRKFNKLSDVEKVFMEKISDLENKLKKYKDELQRKVKIISELEAKLKAEIIANRSRTEVESFQKAISEKEAVIQNLISEKQALDSELKCLGVVLEKIQHTFRDTNEDKEAFLSIVESKEKICTNPREDMRRVENINVDTRKDSEFQPALDLTVDTALSHHNLCDAYSSKEKRQANNQEFHAIEPAFSATQSVCSVPESTTTAQTKLINAAKYVITTTTCQVDSECSTTQAETSECPG